jgi:diphthamide biosynthesis protein 3
MILLLWYDDDIEKEFSKDTSSFYYPCPCGDRFSIALEELMDGEDIATCPSCTLRIRVVVDDEWLQSFVSSQSKGEG